LVFFKKILDPYLLKGSLLLEAQFFSHKHWTSLSQCIKAALCVGSGWLRTSFGTSRTHPQAFIFLKCGEDFEKICTNRYIDDELSGSKSGFRSTVSDLWVYPRHREIFENLFKE
jgi:hypothetical protein